MEQKGRVVEAKEETVGLGESGQKLAELSAKQGYEQQLKTGELPFEPEVDEAVIDSVLKLTLKKLDDLSRLNLDEEVALVDGEEAVVDSLSVTERIKLESQLSGAIGTYSKQVQSLLKEKRMLGNKRYGASDVSYIGRSYVSRSLKVVGGGEPAGISFSGQVVDDE